MSTVNIWDDHQLPTELCEIMAYHWHGAPIDLNVVPVVNRPAHASFLGQAQHRNSFARILIMLPKIYRRGLEPAFSMWKELLTLALHELGHFVTYPLWRHIPGGEYQYKERGYFYTEQLADDWANREFERLAAIDDRVFQPKRLGAYITARRARRTELVKTHSNGGPPDWRELAEYRKFVTGGQYTTGEAARRIGAFTGEQSDGEWIPHHPRRPRYSVIRRIGADLARTYKDSAGRKHLFFVHGDLPKLARRYTMAEAQWTS